MILLTKFAILVTALGLAFPEWLQLTDNQNKNCSAATPCHITQNKSKQRFDIVFDLSKDGDKLSLTAVNIGLTGQPKQIYKDLLNFQRHYEDEKFGVFAVDLNSDGYLDLALEASRALRQGQFYFYFIFNPKTSSFVLTPAQIERLNVKDKGELVSAGSNQVYKVDSHFKLLKK